MLISLVKRAVEVCKHAASRGVAWRDSCDRLCRELNSFHQTTNICGPLEFELIQIVEIT